MLYFVVIDVKKEQFVLNTFKVFVEWLKTVKSQSVGTSSEVKSHLVNCFFISLREIDMPHARN